MTDQADPSSPPRPRGAKPLRVLVCGATGYLGGHVLEVAKARGHWVRALVRDAGRFGDRREQVDEVFEGQATDAATLAGLCEGIDVVFSSLGNRTLARKPDCWQVDQGANMNILARAREAGVGHFVFVAVLHGGRTRAEVPQIEARERVVDALAAGDTPWTIIRPSGFFNDLSEVLEMAGSGRAWVFGAGDERFNPIHGADLAEVCVDTFGDQDCFSKEIPVGGPGVLSMVEIAEAAFAALGKEPKISSVPMWVLRAGAKVIKPFNVNVASLLLMFAAMSGTDLVTDRYGRRHIAEFFRERVREGTLAVRG